MKHREALLCLTLAFLFIAVPIIVGAQQPAKVSTIGFLSQFPGSASSPPLHIKTLLEGLKELGYVEGKNIAMEYRFAEGKASRLPELAAELVQQKVDIIVTDTGWAAVQAKKVTQTIPIVMVGGADPIGQGLVASLDRPGGNVTGLTSLATESMGKRLQLLAEVVPNLTHVGVLWSGGGSPVPDKEWAETQAAAQPLKVQLHSLVVRSPGDFPVAFAEVSKQQIQAAIQFDTPVLTGASKQIAEMAIQNRLPTISPHTHYPQQGGLMAYGYNALDLFRRSATYVDRILKGANPADMPLEKPTKYLLIINLKTSKAIDLTIPQSVLSKADRVIE